MAFQEGRVFRVTEPLLTNKISNLPGLVGLSGGNTSRSPDATLQNYSDKRATENLAFPLDVEGDPGLGNHGHYIMFYINAQEKARLQMGEARMGPNGKDPERSNIESAKQFDSPKFVKSFNLKTGKYELDDNKKGVKTNINDNAREQGDPGGDVSTRDKASAAARAGKAGVAIKRPPTRRLKTAIAMFMPASIQTNYGADYTDTPMGAGVQAGLQIYDALNRGEIDMTGAVNIAEDTLKEALTRGLLSLGSMIPLGGGLEEAESIRAGRIITNRLELAFKGIGKREFSYTFKMTPRSRAEAEEIRKIIFAFKYNMLPEYTDGNRQGRRLTVPNTFDITYMYQGQENQFLHKISTCVLESMDVTYGGDRYKTYENLPGDGSPPTETTIALKFREMEIITRDRIVEGF